MEMKSKFLEEKASETSSTAATSSCNLSDVCVYLENRKQADHFVSGLIRGSHEFILWNVVWNVKGGRNHTQLVMITHQGTHLLLASPQSSSDPPSAQVMRHTFFCETESCITSLHKFLVLLIKELFLDQVHD